MRYNLRKTQQRDYFVSNWTFITLVEQIFYLSLELGQQRQVGMDGEQYETTLRIAPFDCRVSTSRRALRFGEKLTKHNNKKSKTSKSSGGDS